MVFWKDLASVLAPLATFIIGLAVVSIAWQQWRVARNKLRLDLFDRRYKVFEATREFLSAIVTETTFETSQFLTFKTKISDSKFLFDNDVVDYLTQIQERSLKMREQQRLLEQTQEESQQLSWLSDQIAGMVKVFTPYLGFSHAK